MFYAQIMRSVGKYCVIWKYQRLKSQADLEEWCWMTVAWMSVIRIDPQHQGLGSVYRHGHLHHLTGQSPWCLLKNM